MDKIPSSLPLPEYPRPQLMRDGFTCLNGVWAYAISAEEEFPDTFDGEILVPFSPEAPLSGVNRQLLPHEFLFYRRSFMCVAAPRTQLNFGACDCLCEVFINGQRAGSHTGGYLPFSLDITGLVRPGENELTVRVSDPTEASYHARGKQMLKRGGIWYTAQSGIWQTVWLEQTPAVHIDSLSITPLYDEAKVEIAVVHNAPDAHIEIYFKGEKKAEADCTDRVQLPLTDFLAWSPDEPNLYDVVVTAGEDRVRSYFGMRKIEIKTGTGGYPRIHLNNREIYLHGVLDQGYFHEGLLTPPSDESMTNDILTMKRMGFNTLRKHIKIEPLRWYYHCDRLGMLVIQDFVNGGGTYRPELNIVKAFFNIRYKDSAYKRFGREDLRGREEFLDEAKQTVSLLYNSPSVIMWTPFNEAWGQFDATLTAKKVKAWDPTRLIDHASGWFDQGGGDFYSMHIYFTRLRKRRTGGRAFLLSEYGGLSLTVAGHFFGGKTFGYRRFKCQDTLAAAFESLIRRLIRLKKRGLCGSVFTQLSDVEDEDNGILTFDRAHVKFDTAKMAELAERLKE